MKKSKTIPVFCVWQGSYYHGITSELNLIRITTSLEDAQNFITSRGYLDDKEESTVFNERKMYSNEKEQRWMKITQQLVHQIVEID